MKVLVFLSRFPYPLEKGDKLRAYYQIKELSKQHKIYLCCLTHRTIKSSEIKELQPYCANIEIIKLNKWQTFSNLIKTYFSHLPFQVAYFYQPQAQQKLDQYIAKTMPKHIYCQLIRTSEYMLKYTIFNKTLDYMDVLSIGMQRRISKAPFFLKALFKSEYERLKNYENVVFEHFTHKTIISEQDRALIQHPEKETIAIIRNGVNTDFFKPITITKKYDLVFTGNMSYPPNVDCAIYLAEEILPLVHQTLPNVTLLISGATPTKKVRSLASKHISVSGWVDDIRNSYAQSHIFVAPMRIGTGLQNKLLEAMAMQIPSITSDLANNALQGKHNENIVIGKTTADFSTAIIELLSNPELARKIAKNGHQFVHTNYNWESFGKQLNQLIDS